MPRDKRALLSLTSTAPVELVPVRLVAHEKISELFRFEIEAVADSTTTIDAQSMLNKPACLSVNYQEQPTRHFHGIVSEFGSSAAIAKAFSEQDAAVKDHLVSLRESASGVSIDEEMIALQRAQRGYEAIAKVIQTTDEMLQTLMALKK